MVITLYCPYKHTYIYIYLLCTERLNSVFAWFFLFQSFFLSFGKKGKTITKFTEVKLKQCKTTEQII